MRTRVESVNPGGRLAKIDSVDPDPRPAAGEAEVMSQASRAFASADDPLDLAEFAATWACAATGSRSSAARILLPEGRGRLVQGGAQRWPSKDRGDLRLRREVLRWHLPRCSDSEGRSLLVQPLLAAGAFVGLMELRADTAALHPRMKTVEVIARQAALALGLVRERNSFDRTLRELRRDGALIGAILGDSPACVARRATNFIHLRYEVPAAGWARSERNGDFVLASAFGLQQDVLERRASLIRRLDGRGGLERAMSAFRAAAGIRKHQIIPSVDVVLAFGDLGSEREGTQDVLTATIAGLLAAMRQLHRTASALEDFELGLAETAHELRRPLVAARAVMERVSAQGDVDESSRGLIDRSRRELDALSDLVEAALELPTDAPGRSRQLVDIGDLTRKAISSIRFQACTRRIWLSLPEGPVHIEANPHQLRMALANVIRNGLEHSPPDSRLDVSVFVEESGVRIEVRDRGCGVPPEQSKAVFEPFVQGKKECRGSGLGLYIARRAVELHHGAIWVEPEEVGSTFVLSIPWAADLPHDHSLR